MWTRLLLKPWWVRALAPAGVLALVVVEGLCAHGLAAYPHRSWLVALAERVAVIVIVSLLLAASTVNSHRAYTNAVAGLDSEQRSAAIAASVRGAVPADAPVRDAAIRIARARRVSAVRWRPWLTAWLGLAALDLVLSRWLTGEKSSTDWTDLVVILCFAAGAWYVSLSVERRLKALSHGI
jgi:hypothetical protein